MSNAVHGVPHRHQTSFMRVARTATGVNHTQSVDRAGPSKWSKVQLIKYPYLLNASVEFASQLIKYPYMLNASVDFASCSISYDQIPQMNS